MLKNELNYKTFTHNMRELMKFGLSLFEKVMIGKQISYNDIELIDLKEVFAKDFFNKYNEHKFLPYTLIIIPFVFKNENNQINDILQWFSKNKPETKIVIVNLMGKLRILINLTKENKNLEYLFNVICVEKEEKLNKILKRNL